MKVKYVVPGPDALDIADARVVVALGETVEVPDDIAERLLERPDFEPAGAKKETKGKEAD